MVVRVTSRLRASSPWRGHALVAALVAIPAALSGAAARGGEAPGEAQSGQAETTAARPRFTVATFNMNWGNVDLADTARVIRASAADVVCMQETSPASERYLRRNLAREYPHMAFRKGERFSSGFAVLSRSQLLKVRLLKPRYGYFATLFCVLRLGGRKVLVVSLHLEPIVPREGESFAGLLMLMRKTEAVHAGEIRRIYSKLPAEAPVVLAGDLNSTSYMFAPRFLASHGFVDSFASVTERPDSHVTWHWEYGGVDWRFRLDYVFHTRHFVTRDSRIVEAASSDHHLVVSTLEWIEDEPPPLPALDEPAAEADRHGGGPGGMKKAPGE